MSSPLKQPNSFPLRMPDELRARIEARAEKNSRSANAEIVVMLTAMLDAESELGAVPTDALLAAVVARLGASVQIVLPTAPEPKAKRGSTTSTKRK